MDLPPMVIQSRRAASVPLPIVVSPGASGLVLALPPPAPPLPLPGAQPRGCGVVIRSRQAASVPLPLAISPAHVA